MEDVTSSNMFLGCFLSFSTGTVLQKHTMSLYFLIFRLHVNKYTRKYALNSRHQKKKTSHNVDEHIPFLESVLSVLGKTFSIVISPFSDICSFNQSMSKKMGISLIGCASHRFHLPINELLSEQEKVIWQVHYLMVKLRIKFFYAKLRFKTDVKPRIRNEERWSYTLQKIKRHVQL